jgi:glycosyltransferase involved in cell wall biosynthesis
MRNSWGTMAMNKTALVAVLADVSQDPRVRRQIDWLESEGWTVDSLGLGPHPTALVRDHFEMSPVASWTRTVPGLAFIHTLLSFRRRFRLLVSSRFPSEVVRRVADGHYDLLILNDTHLLPWLSDATAFTDRTLRTHIHVDLHEWFSREVSGATRGRFLIQPYHRWGRDHIGHPLVSSRSVAGGTAERYVEEFGCEKPLLVRNMPNYEEHTPSSVNPERIELIHHGLAAWARGFREMVDAMRLVDQRFVLTFMLAGSPTVIAGLQEYIGDQRDRIKIVPPAKMVDLAGAINPYDVEVMFFPPTTVNLELTLPNKLFEAVQGRLAVVSGPTQPMVEVIHEVGVGVITEDWTPESLARAINSLDAPTITAMKTRSHESARALSAEAEKSRFIESLRLA